MIFATQVKKRKVLSVKQKLKFVHFWVLAVRLLPFLDQFVLFIQSCILPTNWINRFPPSCCKDHQNHCTVCVLMCTPPGDHYLALFTYLCLYVASIITRLVAMWLKH